MTQPIAHTMVKPRASANIEAHIQGDTSGQIAIGNHNLLIGSIHGGKVDIIAQQEQPRRRPRATPVLLRPQPFPNLLDRIADVASARSALEATLAVEFCGQEGIGKTSLLRHLAHHPPDGRFPDGIVYLWVRHQAVDDLQQSLYDAFYESDVPCKPTDAQLRHALQRTQALIILDDVALSRDELEALRNVAPQCTFLLASEDRRLWGEGHTVALRGLPLEDARALVERELGRVLTDEEGSAIQALYTALNGHPLRLIQVAAMVREGDCTLAEAAQRVQSTSPGRALTAQVLASLSEPERRVLMAIAALNGAPLHADHVSALTGIRSPAPTLEALLERGLIQAHSPRYSLTGGLAQDLRRALDLTAWAQRALSYFRAWAEGQRPASDRLLEESAGILELLQIGVEKGRWSDVLRLGRAVESALILAGRWRAWQRVLNLMRRAARALGDLAVEAWAWHQLGTRALCLEDSTTARGALIRALRMRETLGDRSGAELTRHNLSHLFPPPAGSEGPDSGGSGSSGGRGASRGLLLTKVAITAITLGGMLAVWWLARQTSAAPTPTSRPPLVTPTRIIAALPTTAATHTPAPSATVSATALPTDTPTDTATATSTATPTERPTSTPAPTDTPLPTSTPWPCDGPPSHWQPYSVLRGDTLYALSRRSGAAVDEILCYNRLTSADIWVGQRLYLPPLPPKATPAPEPRVRVWLEEGCDTSYEPGDRTRLFVETNVGGATRIWLDQVVVSDILMSPRQAQPIPWAFDRESTGQHRFQAVLSGSANEVLAEASCGFTLRDEQGPVINGTTTTPPTEQVCAGDTLTMKSTITDPSGVERAELTYTYAQDERSGYLQRVPLNRQGESDVFVTALSGLNSGTLQFSIEASDRLGNTSQSQVQAVSVATCLPDLVITALDTTGRGTIIPRVGIAVPIRVVVNNQGSTPADLFKVATEYAGPRAGWQSVAFSVTGQGSWYPFTHAPLPAGSAVTFAGKVTFPSELQGQTVSLRITADGCHGDELMPGYCRVEESNENNNTSRTIILPLPAMDSPPTAEIKEPQDGTKLRSDTRDEKGYYATVKLLGYASDQEDADEALIIEWTSDVQGLLGRERTIGARLYAGQNCQESVSHKITLSVKDSAGHVSASTISVFAYPPACQTVE